MRFRKDSLIFSPAKGVHVLDVNNYNNSGIISVGVEIVASTRVVMFVESNIDRAKLTEPLPESGRIPPACAW
jgi:hypothetical protein